MGLFDYSSSRKQLAVLVDPQKNFLNSAFIEVINTSNPDYIFVGGSQSFSYGRLDSCISLLKNETSVPLVLFPGSNSQIHSQADVLLALSVLQADNNKFIFSQLVESIQDIESHELECIYTPYILGRGVENTAVGQVLEGSFDKIDGIQKLSSYLKAISYLSPKCLYIEAGSGNENKIEVSWIQNASQYLPSTYLIVGGGHKSIEDIKLSWENGGNCVVIGNYLEENPDKLFDFCEFRNKFNEG